MEYAPENRLYGMVPPHKNGLIYNIGAVAGIWSLAVETSFKVHVPIRDIPRAHPFIRIIINGFS